MLHACFTSKRSTTVANVLNVSLFLFSFCDYFNLTFIRPDDYTASVASSRYTASNNNNMNNNKSNSSTDNRGVDSTNSTSRLQLVKTATTATSAGQYSRSKKVTDLYSNFAIGNSGVGGGIGGGVEWCGVE